MVLPFASQINNSSIAPAGDDAFKAEIIFCVQGAISPLLANIYLHYVLDEWFERVVRLRLKGRWQLVRYADDAVIAFEDHLSGKRLLDVLGKRLGQYGLQLHPTKTRFVDFRFKRPGGAPSRDGGDHI
ncbi:reverse transcriptase domain-containing protein [Bradyrhizobium sp. 164]|uniref:reverse transcriptase domain-containing protein n=1 Tax=Bradyrhizobium sp. 164 TaxID=2782637 RepID=UPI001FFBF6C0|nr:reverse transcriptase domain-containing protein [Bradyrhizobium sp. 164]